MSGEPLDLELATTALLADHRDQRELLKMLARQLAGTLGPRCDIEREGRFLRKSEEIRSLRVRIGDEEFLAEVNRGLVSTSVGHDSGGIRIRTERVATDEWLNRLLQALQREAESNQASRMAIENLVMGGRS